MMQRVLMAVWLVALPATSLQAQGLRDKLDQLFIFGPGQDALFLAGTADPNNPAAIQAHSTHFVPAATAGNAALIAFVTNAIAANVATVPFSATSGGTTFRFEGGVPVQTSASAGPIFAERAQTLGRGRALVGANINALHFSSIRGVPLDDIKLNFTHTNSDFPGCDTIFGGDCSLMGVPQLENDVIAFNLALDVNVRITSLFLTYGLLDRVDIGIALPVVNVSMHGASDAQVIPFGGPTAAHFFAGTPADPVLTASRAVEGNSTGLGDVAARVKIGLSQGPRTAFALLGDVRFPTGSTEDLLGSGHLAVRGLGVLSARFGPFSPHANVGYLFRNDSLQANAVLATLGFDHALASWVTLAVDVASELQAGDNKLLLPATVVIDKPYHRTVEPSSIPDTRDDQVNGSFGFKFRTRSGVTLIANATWPLNRGGLRSNLLWTAGAEYNF